MSTRRRPTQPPLKTCASCGAPISESRAPVLLMTPDLRIVGTFHAGCAARIVLANKGERIQASAHTFTEYGRVLPAREETLPE